MAFRRPPETEKENIGMQEENAHRPAAAHPLDGQGRQIIPGTQVSKEISKDNHAKIYNHGDPKAITCQSYANPMPARRIPVPWQSQGSPIAVPSQSHLSPISVHISPSESGSVHLAPHCEIRPESMCCQPWQDLTLLRAIWPSGLSEVSPLSYHPPNMKIGSGCDVQFTVCISL